MMKKSMWLFVTVLVLALVLAAAAQAEVKITRHRALSNGNVLVQWRDNEANEPYRIMIQSVKGKKAFTRWTVATNVYANEYEIEDIAPGEEFRIYVMDANKDYDMVSHKSNTSLYGGDSSGARMTLSLRKKQNGRATTIRTFSASAIEDAQYENAMYGGTVKATLPTGHRSVSGRFRMAAFLPNGEVIVFMVSDENVRTWSYVYYDTYSFKNLWDLCLKAYDTIPQGNYRLALYCNNAYFGYQKFTVGR